MSVPTFNEILREVTNHLPASSPWEGSIPDTVNQVLREIAAKYLLPDLATKDDVDTETDSSYVTLPATFQRNLEAVYSADQTKFLDIYKSLIVLEKKFEGYLDSAGKVYGVAVQGRNLHYQYIPETADTLTLHFYKYPTLLTVGGAGPACLPEHMAKPLLAYGALRKIYTEMEAMGMKVDPQMKVFFDLKYKEAIADLHRFTGPERTPFASISA